MTREELDRLRDDQSEAYVAKIFKDNPNGMTVAPWCNSDFFDQAFCEGFNAAVAAIWPELKKAQFSANVFGKEQHRLRDENQKLQTRLSMLNCPHSINFYGVCEICGWSNPMQEGGE